MPNQTKEQKTSKGHHPKKSVKGKVAFILIALLGLGSYIALDNYRYILSSFQNSAKTNPLGLEQPEEVPEAKTEQSSNELEKKVDQGKDTEDQKPLNENDSDAKPVIVRFGPDLAPDSVEENLSPYDRYVEDQDELDEPEKKSLIENLTDYRMYVANAGELIVRFLEHENYSEQLGKFKAAKLPDEITEIVKMMEEHLTLLDESLTPRQIFPVNSKSLEKLIKVTKTNDAFQKRLELESKITEKLKILTSYIYSPGLQEQFLGIILTPKPLRK